MSDQSLRLHHIFGSLKRTGDWHVPARMDLKQRMGSTELDFADATFEATQSTIEIDMIGGSVEIRVPDDVDVSADVSTTAASYQDHRKARPAKASRQLHLHGRAIWGSIEVRGPKKRHWGRH